MAKLIDRLHDLGKSEPKPIGFGRRVEPRRTPPMLLIAEVAPSNAGKFAAGPAAECADAVLVAGTPGQKAIEALGDLLWGVRLTEASEETLDELKEAGCDFIQVDSDGISAVALRDDGMAHGGELPLDVTDRQARVLDDLPFDYLTVEYTTAPGKLTLKALSEYQAAVSMVGKHIVLEAEQLPEGHELGLLRDLPADALILPGEKLTAKGWQKARELVNELAPRKPRDHHDEPVIAQSGSLMGDADMPDHEYDDDDDDDDYLWWLPE